MLVVLVLASTVVVTVCPADLDREVVLEGPAWPRGERLGCDSDGFFLLARKAVMMQQDAVEDEGASSAAGGTGSQRREGRVYPLELVGTGVLGAVKAMEMLLQAFAGGTNADHGGSGDSEQRGRRKAVLGSGCNGREPLEG